MGRRNLGTATLARLAQSQGMSLEATDNFVEVLPNTVPHAQTQSAAADVCIMAVALQVKYSGVFRVDLSSAFSSNTTAKTVQHKLVVIPFANPASPTFSANGGGLAADSWFGNDVAGPLGDSTALKRALWGGRLSVDAAGVSANGILYNGAAVTSGAANAITFKDSLATPTLTGLLTGSTMTFDWNGYIVKSIAPKVPFTKSVVGTPQFVVAALVLTSTAGGDVVTYANATIGMQEFAYA